MLGSGLIGGMAKAMAGDVARSLDPLGVVDELVTEIMQAELSMLDAERTLPVVG